MNFKKLSFPVVILIFVAILFFYKYFLFNLVPVPGDLLISEYNPWRSYSYLGYVPGSFPSKLQYFDVIRQLYPWKTLILQMLKSGEIPLWNPYNFAGSPLLANFQSAVFYPLNILYFILPQIKAWSILVILQPLLSSIFAYLYCRKIKLSEISSVIAAVSYSYCLFNSTFLEYNSIGHVILWLPYLLYMSERMLERLTYKNIIFLSLGIISSVFAGHIQIFVFVIMFTAAYILFKIFSSPKEKKKKISVSIIFLCIFILSMGLSAVQLFPTFELINYSARVPQSYDFLIEKLLLQPFQLIGFISPDFFGNPATGNYLLSDSYPGNALYIGLVPFVMSIFSFMQFKKSRIIAFYASASIILLLIMTRSPVSELFYKFEIPFFSTGSPTNALFLLAFAISILAGYGVDYFLYRKAKQIYPVIIGFALIFISTWLIITIGHPHVSIKNFMYSSIVFGALLLLLLSMRFFKLNNKLIGIIILAVTIFDLFYFFHKFNPFVHENLVFPENEIISFLKRSAGINRFWGYGTADMQANFATQYSVFSPDGYDPLYPKTYGEFIQLSNNGIFPVSFTNRTRSDAVISGGYGKEDLRDNKYRLKILDILGVRYILDKYDNGSTEYTFPSDRFTQVYNSSGWVIFENKSALPRIYLANNYIIYKNKQQFEKLIFESTYDFRNTVLLEEEIKNWDRGNEGFSKVKQDNKIRIVSFSPNKIDLDVTANKNKILVISDTYYPGWKAYVDGKETKIYRANYTFRSLPVLSGNHKITLVYDPGSFHLGLKITIISGVLLIIFAVFIKKIKYYAQ